LELGCSFEEIVFCNHIKNPLKDIEYMFNLKKLYKKHKIDFSLNFTIKPNIYGTLASKLAGVRSINNVTGLGYAFLDKSLINKIIKILYKISFRFANKVFFQNFDDMNLFLDQKLVKKDIVDRLPGSGMDIEEYKPMEKTENYEGMRFLFVGRLSHPKGAKYYIEAAEALKKKYKDLEFQMIGQIEEEDKNSLKKNYVLEKHEEEIIKYLGTSSDVRQQVRNVDAVVLPTYYREGVPRSLIEAASMALPIITTDNVGCRDIVKDGYNGFLCQPKDVESLIQKIEDFLKLSLKEREALGKNGRIKVEREFDERIVLEKYLKELV